MSSTSNLLARGRRSLHSQAIVSGWVRCCLKTASSSPRTSKWPPSQTATNKFTSILSMCNAPPPTRPPAAPLKARNCSKARPAVSEGASEMARVLSPQVATTQNQQSTTTWRCSTRAPQSATPPATLQTLQPASQAPPCYPFSLTSALVSKSTA